MLASLISLGQNRLDSKRLEKIDEILQAHIIQKHIPGATALVIKDGEIVYNKALGYADIEKGIKLTPNHIFRIASQSKAITSLAAMILWEDGKFLLDEPVSKYVPEFSNPKVLVAYNPIDSTYTTEPAKREITIRDLMRHTSGLAYPAIFSDPTMWSIYEKAGVPSGIGTTKSNLKDAMGLLAKQPLKHHPGEAFTYGLNIDLLGYLIEIWSGQKLDVFMRERVFIPLEMNDTYFHVPTEKHDRVVPLYEFSQAENKIEKINHSMYEGVDANFPKLKGTYLSGGAGLNSTLGDMAKFYSIYLSEGVYKGKQIVSPKTIELMLTNQLGDNVAISPMPPQPENFQFSIGGFSITNSKNSYLSSLSEGSFGWGGAFNTHGWADPKEKIIALLFTQEYLSPHFSIGEEFQIALYQSLVKK
jgi:CubicO group peptidase (beta-lactamase class C family)